MCVQAVSAETSAVKADGVAAAAMKAAETAVMEEMQATAVVKVRVRVRPRPLVRVHPHACACRQQLGSR